ANVDEEFLVDELLTTVVGDDHYPGDTAASEHWPSVAPGDRGVLNTMSPKHFDTSAMADVDDKPPITWIHATADQVVSERSMFDFGTLGEVGAVPGWPGAETMPPQPMETQMRAVLDRYAAGGGSTREVVLQDVGHGIPLEAPDRVAEEIVRTMADA
ncbi:MAG TPA: alpha/beta hydrolase, partial [Nocardioides sp.]|nr:alpha/beta hydrolase [Nocardioides sp.]